VLQFLFPGGKGPLFDPSPALQGLYNYAHDRTVLNIWQFNSKIHKY